MLITTVCHRLLVVARNVVVADEGSVEPLGVMRVYRGSRIGILRSAVPRIRRSQWCRLRPRHIVGPDSRVAAVTWGSRHLVAFHARVALELGNLALVPRVVTGLCASKLSVDGRNLGTVGLSLAPLLRL